MDYIEDDFTDALIDTVCGKLPSTWYTLIGENFDPDEETIVEECAQTTKKCELLLVKFQV